MGLHFQLIGYPIQHSLSPWIHGEFLRKANINGDYTLNEIPTSEDLGEKLKEMERNGIDGFNVTVPYKQKVLSYLDRIDESAKVIGAVNTVVRENGEWVGYNTDGAGYVCSLAQKFPEIVTNKSIRILILGAGGAARGIFYGLSVAGFHSIDIANRTVEKAREITKIALGTTKTNALTLQEAESMIDDYDVVIQTTSVGMKPKVDKTILSLKKLKEGAIVSDIVYQPRNTTFLKQAEELGANIHYGHTMLLYQAQLAFELWTGIQVDMGNMDEELQQILEGMRTC